MKVERAWLDASKDLGQWRLDGRQLRDGDVVEVAMPGDENTDDGLRWVRAVWQHGGRVPYPRLQVELAPAVHLESAVQPGLRLRWPQGDKPRETWWAMVATRPEGGFSARCRFCGEVTQLDQDPHDTDSWCRNCAFRQTQRVTMSRQCYLDLQRKAHAAGMGEPT